VHTVLRSGVLHAWLLLRGSKTYRHHPTWPGSVCVFVSPLRQDPEESDRTRNEERTREHSDGVDSYFTGGSFPDASMAEALLRNQVRAHGDRYVKLVMVASTQGPHRDGQDARFQGPDPLARRATDAALVSVARPSTKYTFLDGRCFVAGHKVVRLPSGALRRDGCNQIVVTDEQRTVSGFAFFRHWEESTHVTAAFDAAHNEGAALALHITRLQ
jgi:hypothetical protein